jgi:hypothetical protein
VLDGTSSSWNEAGIVQNTARFRDGRLAAGGDETPSSK